MARGSQSLRNLARLMPSGMMGLSMSLAYADASAAVPAVATVKGPESISNRLQSIRRDVTSAQEQYAKDREPVVGVNPEERLAWWGNAWHNGGWHNGGWGNGGWHNGGWGNGGWHNGWHNW